MIEEAVPRDGRSEKVRNPRRTRERLMQAAFAEVYKTGFQSAALDTILASAGVTKGALYHHFDSKEALGHAIIDEMIAESTREKWLRPLGEGGEPIDILIGIVQATSFRTEDVQGGCPLNNLAQEMSPLDKEFRERLKKVFVAWQEGIAAALRRGQSGGTVRCDVDAAETASFLIATYEGYVSLAKNAQDATVLKVGVKNMVEWLKSLRAPAERMQ